MGHTRTVTGLVHRPDGSPWDDFQLDFTLVPSAVTTHATLPSATVSATTGADGTFSVDLEVGVAYQVTEYTALIRSGTSTRYPKGTTYTIVVPDGDTPISLHEIRAADATPVTPTLLGRVLPDGGTTGQALVKASDSDYDATWSDVASGPGGDAVWGAIDGDITDQTDLQTALGGKADDADVTAVGDALAAHTGDTANPHAVTAAQVGAYTTAQVDTALAGKADTGDIPALPATIVESVVAGANVTVDSTDPARPVVSAAGGGGGGAAWGAITGTLADQTDLKAALDAKPALAGDGSATTAAKSDHQHAGTGTSSTALGGTATATGNGGTALGYNAHADSLHSTAVGMFAQGAHQRTTAIGRQSLASASCAIAIGYTATSNTPDTAVIKANDLDVQRSNGTGATRISLYSPNGTKYWLTVDDSGNLAATPA